MKNYDDVHVTKQRVSAMIDETYSKGYDAACDDCEIANKESYQKGLNDAWEYAKLLALPYQDGGIDYETLRSMFGNDASWQKAFMNYSASEVIAKIKEYEEKKKADEAIKIGDEVLVDGRRMIVLGIDSGGWKHLWCPFNACTYHNIVTSEMTKTGKHFDIHSLLEQMNDEQ